MKQISDAGDNDDCDEIIRCWWSRVYSTAYPPQRTRTQGADGVPGISYNFTRRNICQGSWFSQQSHTILPRHVHFHSTVRPLMPDTGRN